MSTIENGHPEGSAGADAATRFAELWDQHVGRVHRYVSRHTDPHSADDVVSETFLVAWRRLDDVPRDALPWLFVVARNTLANARRSTYRRRAVEIELARVAHLAADAPTPGAVVPERAHILAALARLSPTSREIVLLLAWDGLDTDQEAQVLGTSQAAVKMRLSRAPRSLAAVHDRIVGGRTAVTNLRTPRAALVAPPTRRRRALVGVAATGALAIVAGLTLPGIGSDEAYASWTPAPSALTGTDLLRAETACGNSSTRATTVLAERRGVFAFTLRTDRDQVTDCLVTLNGTGGGSARDLETLRDPADGQALVAAFFTTWNPDDGHASAVYGRVGDAVEAVTITRSTGYEVQATVADGWWAAWWPGDTDPDATLTVRRTDGTATRPVALDDPAVDDHW